MYPQTSCHFSITQTLAWLGTMLKLMQWAQRVCTGHRFVKKIFIAFYYCYLKQANLLSCKQPLFIACSIWKMDAVSHHLSHWAGLKRKNTAETLLISNFETEWYISFNSTFAVKTVKLAIITHTFQPWFFPKLKLPLKRQYVGWFKQVLQSGFWHFTIFDFHLLIYDSIQQVRLQSQIAAAWAVFVFFTPLSIIDFEICLFTADSGFIINNGQTDSDATWCWRWLWVNWRKIAVIQESTKINFVSLEYGKFIAIFHFSLLEDTWTPRDKFVPNVQKTVHLIKTEFIYPFSQFP